VAFAPLRGLHFSRNPHNENFLPTPHWPRLKFASMLWFSAKICVRCGFGTSSDWITFDQRDNL